MQNICLGVRPAAAKGGDEGAPKFDSMASLLSASSFYVGVQPTESELMPSAERKGPLLLEGGPCCTFFVPSATCPD